MPESADFVMFWWHKAANAILGQRAKRFGLITTNSIRNSFNRRILHEAIKHGLQIFFAIPDHPWVDTADGADVRIAMTVGGASDKAVESKLYRVVGESVGDEGESSVQLDRHNGAISADLSTGADVSSVVELRGNASMASRGVIPHGDGFILSLTEAKKLGWPSVKVIKPYRNGRDVAQVPRDAFVVDLFGLNEKQAREQYPAIYQHLLVTVKPERDQNPDPARRRNWWLHARSNEQLRNAISSLTRYIATPQTARHRYFIFLDGTILPDDKLIAIGSDDAYYLGVLSSRIHVAFMLRAGSRLGVGNDPVYDKSRCFDPFPFPDCAESLKEKIRALAEELDAHRKRAQEKHGLGLTAIYNVLEKVRANQPLTAKEQLVHDQALVSTLRRLHDQIDAAVAEAYGWPWPMADEGILTRVVALNAERVAEEARGKIRWLRPEFQAPAQQGITLKPADGKSKAKAKAKAPRQPAPKKSRAKTPWPAQRAAQVEAVFAALTAVEKPVGAKDVAATFARADAKAIAEILSALVTLGRIQRGSTRGTYHA